MKPPLLATARVAIAGIYPCGEDSEKDRTGALLSLMANQ